jgi:hypothetical protein
VLPLPMWLWIGGGLLLVGTLLSAFPGQRRRPTDPVSAPIGVKAVAPDGGEPHGGDTDGDDTDGDDTVASETVPVGV